jgi:hypothetical protein
MPHPCNFIKRADSQPCGVIVHVENPTACCGTHAPIAARMPPRVAGQCEHIIGAGVAEHWCARAVVPGDRLCANHVDRRARANEAFRHQVEAHIAAAEAAGQALRARMEAARAAIGYYGDARDAQQERARAFVAEVGHGVRVAPAQHIDPLHVMAQAMNAARPPPVPALQRLAQDTQNVHTAAVAKQTSEGEAKLLAVKTDGKGVGLKVLRTFAARGGTLHQVMTVMNDVDHWYRQVNCRSMGDRLYSRVLEGLWTLISEQSAERQKELHQRLWEEMNESVGMCCDGHISRLVNVMVGFDDAFKAPISQGEILQAKMAEIAGMSVETDVKVAYARTFMTELGMPADEQVSWLEAFE